MTRHEGAGWARAGVSLIGVVSSGRAITIVDELDVSLGHFYYSIR